MPAQISYSWKEVARHNTQKSAWVSVRGKVYDVTSWMNKHPGGRDVILVSAGRDITELFQSYHEFSPNAFPVLKKYEIGVLSDNELPVFPPRGKFYTTLKDRIQMYFEETNQDPKFHPMMIVRYATVLATIAISYYLQFFNNFVKESIVLSMFFSVVLGLACAQVGLLLLHDGSHCSFTHNPIIWRILGYSHDFLNGASFMNWMYQHVLGHHPYTNIAGADPDISTNEIDVRRIKETQKWIPAYIMQHIYSPIIYGLLGIKVRISDVKTMMFEKMNDNIRVNPLEDWQLQLFWAGKAFFLFYRFLVPLVIAQMSTSRVFWLFIISDLVSSYWLALTFQANHVVEGVEWPTPNNDNEVSQDWAEIQVVTAQDYCHGDFFWTNLAGALNYQIIHHLFPTISQHYYPCLVPLVKKTCDEFKIKYRVKESWADAFGGHLKLLKELGQPNDHHKTL